VDTTMLSAASVSLPLAKGYDSAALVVSMRHAKRLDLSTFSDQRVAVLGVDSKAQIHQIYP
jgi:hypothetical protein